MHTDDAIAFIVDFISKPRSSGGYGTYGYEIYLPNVIAAYLMEVEQIPEHLSTLRGGQRARELSPYFLDAAWTLCRQGILRLGVAYLGAQSDAEGSGYSVTSLGRLWIKEKTAIPIIMEPTRLGQLFAALSARYGDGFLQRANEAVRCHAHGSYLAACVMSGAAAESILLAVAIAKSRNEAGTLNLYQTAQGRRKVIESVVGQARQPIAGPFRAAMGLLVYWRDAAAHGLASIISEIEAHEAISRLLRFAQFAHDNWVELTA